VQLGDALAPALGVADDVGPVHEEAVPEVDAVLVGARLHLVGEILLHAVDLLVCEPGALGEVAALVLAPCPEELAHAVDAEAIELVDGAEHGQPLPGLVVPGEADRLHDAIEDFSVVDLDDVVAALDPDALEGVGRHHADLGVGRDRGRADRVGVELHELAEAPRPGLLVAEHEAGTIAAVRLRQRIEVLGHVARERRGEVVAQRQPLLVVVLEREHALVRPVLVGQEFPERVGVLDERRLERLEAVQLVGLADGREHALRRGEIARAAVREPARQPRFQLVVGLAGHARLLPRALNPASKRARQTKRAGVEPARPVFVASGA
jgi:hypothetical protein